MHAVLHCGAETAERAGMRAGRARLTGVRGAAHMPDLAEESGSLSRRGGGGGQRGGGSGLDDIRPPAGQCLAHTQQQDVQGGGMPCAACGRTLSFTAWTTGFHPSICSWVKMPGVHCRGPQGVTGRGEDIRAAPMTVAK